MPKKLFDVARRQRWPSVSTMLLFAVMTAATVASAHQRKLYQKTDLIQRLENGETQSIVVYGTSLTAGGSWVGQVSSRLNAAYPGQIAWFNGGMSGRASNSGVARLEERVLAHQPDAVFLEFAVNDAFIGYPDSDIDFGITPAIARSNLESMINRITADRPGVQIVLQTMNPSWDAPNGNGSGSKRPNLTDYYQVYREVAAERDLILVDNNRVWKALQANDPDEFAARAADGVHPGAAGYQRYVTPAILFELGAEAGLVILVNVETGRLVLCNQSNDDVELISYTISSPAGALQPERESLAASIGDGWTEANPTQHNLSELNASGSLSVAATQTRDLGLGWDASKPLDLSFVYQTPDGRQHTGAVIYTAESLLLSHLAGDYNNDGLVNAADFTVWRDLLGSETPPFTSADGDGDGVVGPHDYAVWRANYGSHASFAAERSLPELTAVAATISLAVAFVAQRRSTLD